jgi:hypothetical protein
MYYFPERKVQLAASIFSIIFSAILLIGAILCLNLISKNSWKLRLGMIIVFTSLFAGVVGLLTNAQRAEIFASTAAYVPMSPSEMKI